jgi:hypothetical protein
MAQSYHITVAGRARCAMADAFPEFGLGGLCSDDSLEHIELSAARLFAEHPQSRVHIELGTCPMKDRGEW